MAQTRRCTYGSLDMAALGCNGAMTTIATDGVSMSGDGRICCGDERVSDVNRKVHRAQDGRLFGVSGCSYSSVELIRYMTEGVERPDLPDGISILILNVDGTIDLMNHRYVPVRVDAPNAIGSGADYAMGAMCMGASTEEAVKVAARFDMFTGGSIVTMTNAPHTR